MTDTPREDARRARIARDAAVQSLVSNVVYLAVMLGFTLALAKRDWVGRQLARAGRWRARDTAGEAAAVAALSAELSAAEHSAEPW